MNGKKILITENLHGGYGSKIKILHGVDIHVDDKEIVCMLGPNGSGKSTLAKLIYGLVTHHEGRIIYNQKVNKLFVEHDITSIPSNKLSKIGIAYVPQTENVFPNLTIDDNLEMGGYILENDELTDAKERVYQTYPILKERKSNRAKTLSGGQRQMLALGRSLMIDPSLIILDEPSAALQPNLVMEIMDRIGQLRDDLGKAILIIEQNAKSALAVSDRGYILAAGRLVHEDTGYNLLHHTDLASYYLGTNKSKN